MDETLRLIFENSRDTPVIGTETARDLGVHDVAAAMSGEFLSERRIAYVLSHPASEVGEIAQRQAVFADLRRNPSLSDALKQVVPRIDELSSFGATRREAGSVLEQTIWRLGELELFVECVEVIGEALSTTPELSSERLQKVARRVEQIRAMPEFDSMRTELPEMRRGLRQRRSLTLGVNLDEKLRPVEAAVLSIDATPFRQRSILGRLFGRSRAFSTDSTILSTPLPPELTTQASGHIPLSPLFQELEQLIGSSLRPVQRKLRDYLDVNTEVLAGLRHDIAFFLEAVLLSERLGEAGLPICVPEFTNDKSELIANLHNVHLALKTVDTSDSSSVGNSLELSPQTRFYVLTGPNQGGKTTFTQAIGIAYLMAQSGLFVVADSARIRPVDRIETHFPVGEHGSLETGRLSDEAKRLSAMIDTIGPRSMVLLNESFSSTGPHEGSLLAEELLRVLSHVGVRGVFATHLHDLALRVEQISAEAGGVASLTAEVEMTGGAAHRTYRIRAGKPTGSSFARDIAVRHGLSFEQMQKRLVDRGILPKPHL